MGEKNRFYKMGEVLNLVLMLLTIFSSYLCEGKKLTPSLLLYMPSGPKTERSYSRKRPGRPRGFAGPTETARPRGSRLQKQPSSQVPGLCRSVPLMAIEPFCEVQHECEICILGHASTWQYGFCAGLSHSYGGVSPGRMRRQK